MVTNPQELLIKYISGNCTEEEQSIVLNWAQASPQNKVELDRVKKLWESSATSSFTPDIDRAWAKVSASTLEYRLKVSYRRVAARNWITGIAASLLLVALSYVYFTGENTDWTTLDSKQAKNEYTLPDGSQVWLKQNSRLSYHMDDQSRELKLSGEGFFEVSKDPEKPFVISLGRAQVKVLGTSFYTKARKGEDLQVSVRSGTVSFSDLNDEEKEFILEANEEAIFELASGDMIKRPLADENDLTWQRGVLVFNKTPLSRVIQELTDFYQTKISLEDRAMGNCLITSRFENQTVEQVLQIIKKLLSAELIQTENGFLIKGSGC